MQYHDVIFNLQLILSCFQLVNHFYALGETKKNKRGNDRRGSGLHFSRRVQICKEKQP